MSESVPTSPSWLKSAVLVHGASGQLPAMQGEEGFDVGVGADVPVASEVGGLAGVGGGDQGQLDAHPGLGRCQRLKNSGVERSPALKRPSLSASCRWMIRLPMTSLIREIAAGHGDDVLSGEAGLGGRVEATHSSPGSFALPLPFESVQGVDDLVNAPRGASFG